MLNLNEIKASGEVLALEAELTRCNTRYQNHLKDAQTDHNKFVTCVSYAKDCVQLLEEIVKLYANRKSKIPTSNPSQPS